MTNVVVIYEGLYKINIGTGLTNIIRSCLA